MTVVEKAAYLKGLVAGLGMEENSRDGKLWAALTDLLSDVAHEIEDLHESDLDHAAALDDIGDELSYLEELTCNLDTPEDYDDFECDGNCEGCSGCDDIKELPDDEDEDEELAYDGVIYDATCPVCGEEISFDEETLDSGSISCPKCGEILEFDLSDEEEES